MRAQLAAQMQTLAQSERFGAEDLQALQSMRLRALLQHALAQTDELRERLHSAGLALADIDTAATLARLPLLPRRTLQQQSARLTSHALPPGHGPTGEVKTSGSTGEPVTVTRTAINQLMWMAFTLREHLWHQRDFSGRLAAIRANLAGSAPIQAADWGPPVNLLYASGPGFAMPINTAISTQKTWLAQVKPHYLLTYPNNLAALLDGPDDGGFSAVRQIRTVGETLSPALRQRVHDQLGIGVADTYSSQELGVLAIQCPVSGLYHVMEEGYIVEILRPDGAPCAQGETGRVVVTDLHNYAIPLLRYDIGDYASVGPACPCGRAHKTLSAIAGRERNLLRIGKQRYWPLVGFHSFRDIAPIIQYQLLQHSEQLIEVRLVCATPLSPAQQQALTAVIQSALGHPFQLQFVQFADRLPLSSNGKFEEFVCLMRQPD
ncbi:phenylacetate--CoA ligase family protein [Amantichitinum ursilacus]|uniref:Phenylacetate-coenzyme A ligase n=1 Tax=Amantichitinum ursilacus TaxID=857265 RepID=A0A0N0GQF2_9NEIS|nr:phenylacetate--CoA ligase family protein [Amantichitinum ursilacus]KPC54401.1 Phenylacetate-coenzyme A ligase [Amantichitinum ursilacus]